MRQKWQTSHVSPSPRGERPVPPLAGGLARGEEPQSRGKSGNTASKSAQAAVSPYGGIFVAEGHPGAVSTAGYRRNVKIGKIGRKGAIPE
jgi:hypothetical protein